MECLLCHLSDWTAIFLQKGQVKYCVLPDPFPGSIW